MRRALALLLTLMLALTSMASVAAQTGPSTDPVDPVEGCQYFEETGHNLCGVFLEFWNDNGGLPIFGYPKTEAFDEENWDTGEVYQVQYFERERLEHHTALAGTEYEVLLGRLGNEVLLQQDRYWRDFERSDPSEENYFAETGFAVPQVFLDYWSSYGLDLGDPGMSFRESLALFGYPISQAQMETNSSGDTVLTQWFERARFEHHPDHEEEFQVLLGLLGNEVLGIDDGEEPVDPEPEVVLTMVTDNVSQPRHLSVGGDGAIYVANAGMGGETCVTLTFPDEGGENGEDDGTNGGEDDGTNGGEDDGTNGGEDDGTNGGEDDGTNGGEDDGTNGDDETQLTQNGEGEDNGDGDTNGENGDGDDNGEDPNALEVCMGNSGSITRIADGEAETFISGIPSFFAGDAVGLHDVVVTEEGDVYGVIGFGLGLTMQHRAELGDDAAFFGHLVEIAEDGSLTSIADLLAYETEENPDGGMIDANPYAVVMDGDDFIVADAGANALLRVSMEGEVELIASFPAQMVDAPPFPDFEGIDQIPSESVPTHVAIGPDGNYYVSELTGFPFAVGSARIWMVTPEGVATVVETGFTNIGAIAFDSEGNLLVLEILAGGLLAADPENPATTAGQLTRISVDDVHDVLAGGAQGLAFSTGLAVDGDDTIYVVNLAVVPGAAHVAMVEWVIPEE